MPGAICTFVHVGERWDGLVHSACCFKVRVPVIRCALSLLWVVLVYMWVNVPDDNG